MGKIWIEICLISARGVRSSGSLWKRQWYAVGWVDPKTKYCTKLDANPLWKTKFAVQVENTDPDLALHLQLYSRDPLFLTEKLHGSATILLREFLAKHNNSHEQVGSYQLRKNKSNKPSGFIDVSIRVSQDKEHPNFHPQGDDGGGTVVLDYGSSTTQMTGGGGFGQAYPQQKAQGSFHGPEKQAQTSFPYSHPVPFPADYATDPYVGGPSYGTAGPSYQPPRTTTTTTPPPPPPPPSNVNYAPNIFPSSGGMTPSYFNMPSSSTSTSGAGPRPRGPPGFAIGAGAGALAAGAVMFGDNFMSGFHVGDPTLTIATDPLF